MMIQLIGWLGSVLLALCGLPQALQCFKTKSAAGLSKSFAVMWFLGVALLLVYVGATNPDPVLLANYALNTVTVGVILRYVLVPNKSR